jgi:hypothetical protein
LGHGGRKVASLHPLDARLNLPPDHYSFGVRRRIALAATYTSFDAAVATLYWLALDPARPEKRGADTGGESDPDHPHRRSEDGSTDVRRRRTEREADPDLARAAGDDEGRHAINTCDGHDEREHCEAGRHTRGNSRIAA